MGVMGVEIFARRKLSAMQVIREKVKIAAVHAMMQVEDVVDE